jgi:hypothetical protein
VPNHFTLLAFSFAATSSRFFVEAFERSRIGEDSSDGGEERGFVRSGWPVAAVDLRDTNKLLG